MNQILLKKYHDLAPDWMDIGLRHETKKTAEPYFCTPKGAEIFASLGVDGIHYCTIQGCGDTVFVINPSSEPYVIPVAHNFEAFLRVVLALRGTNPLDQFFIFGRKKADSLLQNHLDAVGDSRKEMLCEVAETFGIAPMESPIDYVFSVAEQVDMSKIKFTKEYYDTLGLEKSTESDFVSTYTIAKNKKSTRKGYLP